MSHLRPALPHRVNDASTARVGSRTTFPGHSMSTLHKSASRPTSRRHSPSPGPPQLSAEEPTEETMSLGSGGSPVDFLDPATYEAILESLRDVPGQTPAFSGSPPGTPPQLSLETTTRDGHTQTGAFSTREKSTSTFVDVTHTATQVSIRPHVWSSSTQTSIIAPSSQDQSTQVLIRPRRHEAFTQTGRLGTVHRPSQTDSLALSDAYTSMTPVLVATTGCQAGAIFDNDVIPPGVLRPRLPWGYTYEQFEVLLTAYPTVHPEDYVSFGVLRSQPRPGSRGEWGAVAGVLEHMVGGNCC